MTSLVTKRATIVQVSSIMEFSARAVVGTTYDDPATPYHAPTWRKTLIEALRDPSQALWATWEGGKCVGMLLAQEYQMPWTLAKCASDIVFVADKGGDQLLAAFTAWADARKVARIDMGVSDHGDRPGFDRFFSAAGFNRAGRVYYRLRGKQ